MLTEAASGKTGKAIAFLLFGVTAGLCLDLCAKELLKTHSLNQFVLLRSLIGLLMFLLLAPSFGGLGSLQTRRWHWHVLRTLLAAGSMYGFFYGLARMPLVNALTLAFTAPLMVTALSVPLLGERVGWRRWLAVMVGFVGVLLVVRPGVEGFTAASFAVLFAGFCYALLAITARKLADTESSYSLSVYVIAGPLLTASAASINDSWIAPDAKGWLLFVAAGLCSVCAWIGIVGAYRRAAPAVLAPLEYLAIVGGTVAGFLIWNERPDIWVIAGAAVITASGVFVAYREVGASLSVKYLRAVTTGVSSIMAQRLRRTNRNL
ncbi:MAG: DMT family transporter [Pseudomonadota bacterium]